MPNYFITRTDDPNYKGFADCGLFLYMTEPNRDPIRTFIGIKDQPKGKPNETPAKHMWSGPYTIEQLDEIVVALLYMKEAMLNPELRLAQHYQEV